VWCLRAVSTPPPPLAAPSRSMQPCGNITVRLQADCGWITGHTYMYGPLLQGASLVVSEGMPTYPSPSRCWQIVDKYKVRAALPWRRQGAWALMAALVSRPQ
jgi:hypothetical protein